jgi:hypothetical protein
MGDCEFDIDLLMTLVEAMPVLWDKMDDIYKDRNEMKKAWREVCICLQEDFKALEDVQKNAFGEHCHNLLNTADCKSYKLLFFCSPPPILCTLLFIFLALP